MSLYPGRDHPATTRRRRWRPFSEAASPQTTTTTTSSSSTKRQIGTVHWTRWAPIARLLRLAVAQAHHYAPRGVVGSDDCTLEVIDLVPVMTSRGRYILLLIAQKLAK